MRQVTIIDENIATSLKRLTHPRAVVSVCFFIGTILQTVQLNLMNRLINLFLMTTHFDNLKGCTVLQLPLLSAIRTSMLIVS